MYLKSKYNSENKLIHILFIGLLLLAITSFVSAAEPIRFGIMSLAQPARIHKQWQPFVDYVSKKSGYEIKIVIPRGFKKIKKKIANKHVDMFYTNSFVFYRLQKAGKALALAQMQNLEGSIMSNSVIFVRSDSGIKNLKDLKNKSMAFVSPAGAGGYLAPRALFFKQGINTKTDIKEQFTKNLSSSITKVLLGDASAGTMCGLNYNLMSKKVNSGELKIIANSEEYPENMIGIRPEIATEIRERIAKVILGMINDDEGKKVLAGMNGMKIKSFVKPSGLTLQRTKELINTAQMK
ncbi:MAG: phosphate/phosphite/phosphonate ABC transporter substrate-binding protein [Gammaproteobacteria bacterium]|nr:phosphate/phosphite/phosphonate ABC transporter substrate-binding protein [Gammaproteobacteria bacterium]